MPRTLQSFSLVIHPPAAIQDYVKKCKRELHRALNNTWFHSLNSAAHISFVTFITEDIQRHLETMAAFSQQTAPVHIALNGFGSFPDNGCFYLRPDRHSQTALERIMKACREAVPVGAGAYSTNPHISIGRSLEEPQIQTAQSLFAGKAPGLQFECGSLWLRKFNDVKKQYELFLEFPLTGSKTYSDRMPVGKQGSLF